MGRKRTRPLGQITFRLEEAVHKELLESARILGLDMSGLINQMLAEARAAFVKKVAEAVQKQKERGEVWDALWIWAQVPPGGEPLVRAAMEAGRRVEDGRPEVRMEAMLGAIRPLVDRAAPKDFLEKVLTAARKWVEMEAQRAEVAGAVEKLMAELASMTP
jgi:post-segregation antitoxin (ccd killing protein)